MIATSTYGGQVSAYGAKHLTMLSYKYPEFDKVSNLNAILILQISYVTELEVSAFHFFLNYVICIYLPLCLKVVTSTELVSLKDEEKNQLNTDEIISDMPSCDGIFDCADDLKNFGIKFSDVSYLHFVYYFFPLSGIL